MAINFPNNPTNGQIFSEGNKSWQWLGNRWGTYNISNPALTLINTLSTNYNTLSSNMQNIGNYPYLEYTNRLAPNSFGQAIPQNSIQVLTLNSEIWDTENLGALASNIITLEAGSYQYKIYVPLTGWSGAASQTTKPILYLTNNITGSHISIKSASEAVNSYYSARGVDMEGQFKITTQSQIKVQIMVSPFGGTIYAGPQFYDNNGGFSDSTSTNAFGTTIKLWKVG